MRVKKGKIEEIEIEVLNKIKIFCLKLTKHVEFKKTKAGLELYNKYYYKYN